MAQNFQQPPYYGEGMYGYPANTQAGYYNNQMPPPVPPHRQMVPVYYPDNRPPSEERHQYYDHPNSGRKDYNQNPNQNQYPQQVDPQIKKAVEGEKQWNKRYCLDCITKLKGDYEQQAFVRKVFGILSAQLLFTVILCAIVYATPAIEDWLQENLWFYFISLGISIILLCSMVCVKKVARTVPWNYIVLFTFTFFESVMIATISSFYNAESVFLAAVMTFVLFGTMTLISLFTSRKPHTLYMMIYVCFALSLVAIFFLIFFTNRYIIIIAMLVLLVVACIYVMIDIDLITEKHGLSYDDYIIGAVFLYVDIVTIFLYILALFGDRS